MQFLKAWLLRSGGEDRRPMPAEEPRNDGTWSGGRLADLPDILERFLPSAGADIVILEHHRRGRG